MDVFGAETGRCGVVEGLEDWGAEGGEERGELSG